MRVSRVYYDDTLVVGVELQLDKTRFHYLKNVLRLNSGAAIVLFNGLDGFNYQGQITLDKKSATVDIQSRSLSTAESSLSIEIVQGLSRSDHLDWMIQKCTELGVHRISIFNAARSQSSLNPAQLEKKLRHWQAVAISACEQSGRCQLPDIQYFNTLDNAIAQTSSDQRLLLDVSGQPPATIFYATQVQQLAILLGPEGGLTEPEVEQAGTAGFVPMSLGPRVLRTETAAITAVSLAQSNWGDF